MRIQWSPLTAPTPAADDVPMISNPIVADARANAYSANMARTAYTLNEAKRKAFEDLKLVWTELRLTDW